jgi:hypothetical protein
MIYNQASKYTNTFYKASVTNRYFGGFCYVVFFFLDGVPF